MKIKSTRERLLASTMIVGASALMMATGALAQAPASSASQAVQTSPNSASTDTATQASAPTQGPLQSSSPASGGAGNTVQAVTVTGSRIPQLNLRSNSPVQVVGSQELKFQGTTQVENLLNNLPSVVADQNQGVDNGATGTATVDLRGLGSKRTLVLVDGKRLMPGDPIVPVPDLNNIPAGLVDHVEVLTGGASAVYGSDALGGVVNFIMKKNFQGLQLDADGGFFDHNNGNAALRALQTSSKIANAPTNPIDGRTIDVSAIMGINAPDGKGNVTAYATYRNLQPVSQGNRDAGACGLSTISSGTPNLYDTHVCQGSGTSAYGRFVNEKVANNPNGTNSFVPYSGSLAFNFGPYNYFQRQDNRYTAGYYANYKMNDAFDFYSDFMFADDSTTGQAAPSGAFTNLGSIFQVSCDNPLASAAQLATLCGANAGTNALSSEQEIGYRLLVPRETSLTHESYRIDLGSRGEIAPGWNYDAYLQYGLTRFNEEITGDVSISKIQNALNANPDGTCANPLAVAQGCTPVNFFRALSAGISPQQLAYIQENAFQTGQTEEQVVEANINGDLGQYGLKSPFATDGVGVAAGGDYRREQLALQVDEAYASGDLAGAGGVTPPASGSFDVYELYGELRAPLVQDKPFVKELSFDGGYRFSDYAPAGVTNTYKLSGNYAPIDDVRFRASYNRAVRAPNVVELFRPQTVSLGSSGDPCAGAQPTDTLAQCQRSGVTPGNAAAGTGYGFINQCSAAQCNILAGGNPQLKPETAYTQTLGVVVTPRDIPFLRTFSMSVDYYRIKIYNAISPGLGQAVILSQCATANNLCNLIHRNPTDESLGGSGLPSAAGYVAATTVNSGSTETDGFDIAAAYVFRPSDYGLPAFGDFSVNYVGNVVQHFISEPVFGLGKYNCVGYFGPVCGEPAPHYRHEVRGTWTTPWYGVALSVNWRYIDSSKLDVNQTKNTFLGAFGTSFADIPDANIPTFNYIDLAMTWKINDTLTARAGVNNVFDKDPPVFDANVLGIAGTAGFGNGNTFPGVYDALGRYVFFGLTANF